LGFGFTGKERDAETGLDFFGARYYSGAQGRFTSPDQPLLAQEPANPQSWNLYSYGRNNPLKHVDPTGRWSCSYSGGNTPEGGAATDEKACTDGGGTWIPGAGDVQTVENGSGDTAKVDTPYTSVTVNGDTDEVSTFSWYLADSPLAPRELAHRDHSFQERWERFKSCASSYYGLTDLAKWGAIGAFGAANAELIPKEKAAELGLRMFKQAGSRDGTSLLSVASLAYKTAGGGNWLRGVANFGARWAGPIAIASAVVDATALGTCTF
jgi:RHS repeat-associated protein